MEDKISSNKKMFCAENLKLKKQTTYHNIQCWWSRQKVKMLSAGGVRLSFPSLALYRHPAGAELCHLQLCSSKNLLFSCKDWSQQSISCSYCLRHSSQLWSRGWQPQPITKHGRGPRATLSALAPVTGNLCSGAASQFVWDLVKPTPRPELRPVLSSPASSCLSLSQALSLHSSLLSLGLHPGAQRSLSHTQPT